MTKKPEALQIADELDELEDVHGNPILEMRASNELRRLHGVIETLNKANWKLHYLLSGKATGATK